MKERGREGERERERERGPAYIDPIDPLNLKDKAMKISIDPLNPKRQT